METSTNLPPPLIGSASRPGTRQYADSRSLSNGRGNDDYQAHFVVTRENTTRQKKRRERASTEETVTVGETPAPRRAGLPKPNAITRSRPPAAYPYATESTLGGSRPIYVAVVADGVTSTNGGGEASRIAVETVRANLQEPPSRQETVSEWLEFAIQRANDEILFEGKRNPQWEGMSSTIVLAALAGAKLYVLHLGDSRAYLLRAGQMYQLTADHTWAQESLAAGSLSVEEATHHPGRNHLLRYLGSSKPPNIDRGVIALDTGHREEYLLAEPGDTLLLCTDGLHRRVSGGEMSEILLAHQGYPADAAEELIEQAVAKGEQDDITVTVLELPAAHKEFADYEQESTLPANLSSVNWVRQGAIFLLALLIVLLVAWLAWSWLLR